LIAGPIPSGYCQYAKGLLIFIDIYNDFLLVFDLSIRLLGQCLDLDLYRVSVPVHHLP
jgi:hypothetical protein